MSGYAQKDTTISNLVRRNEDWAAGIERIHPGAFPRMARRPQQPKVLWIGCSDSRVPESVITASVPGDIFVHRNIGNQFSADDPSAASVVQFAVQRLRVSHVVVVGHTHCGGVAAAFEAVKDGLPPSGPLGGWLHHLIHLARHHPDATDLTEANVVSAIDRVRDFIEKMEYLDPRGEQEFQQVTVVGMVYELETGRLRELGRREVWPPQEEADEDESDTATVYEAGRYENPPYANGQYADEPYEDGVYENKPYANGVYATGIPVYV
ncbi:carbonic anhydrase [Rhodofomes roseus]|uniref:Carbonic anhydrase n=1 Tax=Rhodofomes roseus TaxID=34475 RepID=A0ABQ8K7R6_9APHY|nr:carbonic anhydrase [Rhodofomes roseus]KAH9832890.1 carbonic anhydrase [Rhodofomes roseus]